LSLFLEMDTALSRESPLYLAISLARASSMNLTVSIARHLG
jgi:hypothetical protein